MQNTASNLTRRSAVLSRASSARQPDFRTLWNSSIAWMQMTKLGAVRTWLGGDDVADLDLAIADDDAGHEALDQLPLLLPGRLRQVLSYSRAELLHARSEASDLGPAIHLRFELPPLSLQNLLLLLELVPSPPVFLKTEHAIEVGRGEPLDLLARTGLPTPQHLAARLQLLRQPVAAMPPAPAPTGSPRVR